MEAVNFLYRCCFEYARHASGDWLPIECTYFSLSVKCSCRTFLALCRKSLRGLEHFFAVLRPQVVLSYDSFLVTATMSDPHLWLPTDILRGDPARNVPRV